MPTNVKLNIISASDMKLFSAEMLYLDLVEIDKFC